MREYVFGVDLGGTTVKLGLFKTEGLLIEKWEIPTRTENNGEQLLPDIAASITNKLKGFKIHKNDIEGIGIGVPGAVLNGKYVKRCVNLNGWGDFDVSEKLSSLVGIPVEVVNDANAAALGEMWQGGAKGFANVIFVTLGTGVGGGIIVDGKVLTGHHGAAGEIGHIKIKRDADFNCGCGKKGCLEGYASATGIVRYAKELIKESQEESKLRDIEDLEAKDVFNLAKEGDAVALKVTELMYDDLGMALAAISCVTDPEIIVLGGGVSKAGSVLLEGVRSAFEKYAFPASEQTQFSLASLGNDAGIYGGARLIMNT
ncbi:MAG TPA: ROK family glucokinase [Clostridiales bacterium]|nr:ROK family glucokinase [Clostridiales bacterium]